MHKRETVMNRDKMAALPLCLSSWLSMHDRSWVGLVGKVPFPFFRIPLISFLPYISTNTDHKKDKATTVTVTYVDGKDRDNRRDCIIYNHMLIG